MGAKAVARNRGADMANPGVMADLWQRAAREFKSIYLLKLNIYNIIFNQYFN